MFDPRQITRHAPTTADLVAAMREADDAYARAVALLAQVGGAAIARERAMPAEAALSLDARWDRYQVHCLFAMAEALASLPATRAALGSGKISFSQARQIAYELRAVPADARAKIDALVEGLAERLGHAEPEALVAQVAHAAMLARPDLALRREDRSVESGYLAISPYLDGSGGTFTGQLDATGLASLATAVQAEADQPADADQEPRARGRQRAEALVRICERSLAGGAEAEATTRPRARMLVSLDLTDLAALAKEAEATDLAELASGGARILWDLLGAGRLTPVATAAELCDAELQAVLFSGARPVAVGDARSTIPAKVRAAVIARDGGCRGPGCRAPASWCQVHHILAKGGHELWNLVLLCTRCHRRMHRRPWKIKHRPDGLIAFTHRGRTYTSAPRARPLRL